MSIRIAQEKDIDGIRKLLFQVNQVHADGRPDLFKSGGIKYTIDDLKTIIADEKRPIYVYEDEEDYSILGYVFVWYEQVEDTTSTYPVKSMYIDDLCVDEKTRGKDIGKSLFEYVKEEARRQACDRITLHVWECNPLAAGFYNKMGMKPLYTNMEYSLND